MSMHIEFATKWVNSIRTDVGRYNLDRAHFLKVLDASARKEGITKITKLRVVDVDRLISVACLPRSHDALPTLVENVSLS